MKTRALFALLSTLCFLGCKENPEYARVFQIESLAQTIGGPAAAGAVGDYMLENDRIRVIVHGRAGDTGSSTAFGGTIIDADLQRPGSHYSAGQGLDQLFELGPMVNLKMPFMDPEDDEGFKVVRAEATEDGGALLRVEGGPGNLVQLIGMLGVVLPALATPDIRFVTEYELKPGDSYVRITCTAFVDGDTSVEGRAALEHFEGSRSLLEMMLGDLEPTCETDADCEAPKTCQAALSIKACRDEDSLGVGSFGAWLALFGGKLKTFVPGSGLDPWINLRTAVAQGVDPFANPTPFGFMAGVGDKVSYGVFNDDGVFLVPLASSNFTVAITNARNCPLKDPDCNQGLGLTMSALLSVGEGDVASAMEPYYEVQDITTGRLKGAVIDDRTGEPVSDADIFVVADPWPDDTDSEIAKRSYTELQYAHREGSRDITRPAGETGSISHMKSDVGDDPRLDGDFSGSVPAEDGGTRYILVAKKGNVLSPLYPVRVSPGKTTSTSVVLPEAGELLYRVFDANGLAIPAKVTVGQCLVECAMDEDCGGGKQCDIQSQQCVPKEACTSNSQCAPDEFCHKDTGACICQGLGQVPREFGGHWIVDGTAETHFNTGKPSRLALPPGTYEAIFSRGFEYSIDRRFVTIEPSRTVKVDAHLDRVVDTTGFISGDFHVHGGNSPDSGVPLDDRMITFAAEGVEFVTSTDHDVLTDYQPAIRDTGLDTWMGTQVGLESSPLMLAHFLSFPMRYDANKPQNMPEDLQFDWFGLGPIDLMAAMRAAGDLGGSPDSLVMIAHVYDYFNYYGLNPFNLALQANAIFKLGDPVFQPINFSSAYNGFEFANGKSQDYIRIPSVAEVRDYNVAHSALVAEFTAGDIDFEAYAKRHMVIGREVVGRMLERTPDEQAAFIDATKGEECGCFPEDSCAAFDSEDHLPCKGFSGVVDVWMRMMNQGIFRTVLANSDSHDTYHGEAGVPRNYVVSSTDRPAQIDRDEVNDALQRGAVVGSYGPFIRFEVNGQPVGSMVNSASGEKVTLSISVQSPLWFDVDRVEVYRDGRIIKVYESCAQTPDDPDCITLPNESVDNLMVVFDDAPDGDSWYTVSAVGVRGKDLAPIYSSLPIARFGFVEATDSLFAVIPVGSLGGKSAREPSVYRVMPYAMTNAIRVDVGGDGFAMPGAEPPDWAAR